MNRGPWVLQINFFGSRLARLYLETTHLIHLLLSNNMIHRVCGTSKINGVRNYSAASPAVNVRKRLFGDGQLAISLLRFSSLCMVLFHVLWMQSSQKYGRIEHHWLLSRFTIVFSNKTSNSKTYWSKSSFDDKKRQILFTALRVHAAVTTGQQLAADHVWLIKSQTNLTFKDYGVIEQHEKPIHETIDLTTVIPTNAQTKRERFFFTFQRFEFILFN